MDTDNRAAIRKADRNLLLAMLYSALILAVGVTWTFRIAEQDADIAHNLEHAKESLLDLKAAALALERPLR